MVSLLKYLHQHPEKLFVLDGVGALLSAFLLGVVLVPFEAVFGIPKSSLYFLAFLPILFTLFDFWAYRNNSGNTKSLLTIIAIMNMIYCCISIGFAMFHYKSITIWGYLYIFAEILVVLSIVQLELKVAKNKVS
ncbi:hypothetical protein [Crocinitomix catalasitica]|uniref:hypothetical protein n=1 Tax=Crocinitomix catalasitica TaxID=184607 RepID=UPI00047F6E7E|nr:hypothetical protein [Crocinitomix catalasitica]